MANKDFRIDLIMRAQFAQAQAALKDADRDLNRLGKSLDGVNKRGLTVNSALRGVGIAAAAAGTAAVAVMGLYIARTIEAEKVQAQLGARVKDTGAVAGRTLKDLNDQAARLQNITVFDDESIGQAQAMLLTFTQIRGQNFDRTIESATDLATVMGTDVADAAKILGKALSDPEQGLGALRKAGVTFTDAQTEVIKKMVEGGQIAEAQKVILDKLQSTMGSAAEAARNTLGGALEALKNSFDNLLEGDSGDAGVVGTREAVESLIEVLNDPSTKQGFDNLVAGAVSAVSALVRLASTTANVTRFISEEIASRVNGPSIDDTVRIEQRMQRLQQTMKAVKDSNGHGPLSAFKLLDAKELIPSDFLKSPVEVVKRLQGELDKEQNKLKIGIELSDGATAQAKAIAAAANAPLPNPTPDGQGIAKPSKGAGSKSKADPDSDIKSRIASLREEAALLGSVADGEAKASEAAKVRYDITEGEFKNKSPQMKAELLLAAEALDQKNADIEAEKKRKEAFEKTRDSYEQLLDELRTPAEAALDKAIEEVNTLNDALKAGITTKAKYDEELGRIAGGLVDKQPDFQGLAPEVGGAFGELGKLDEATTAEEKWYQDSLARLEAFRALKADNNAAANAQEEQLEALHQARMQQIEGARQQAALSIASDFFGQLAQLQRSENSKIAAVGKAAAIAQALINTYQSATAAYAAMASIPYVGPALGVAAAAAAIAAGLANVAQIRSQQTGFSEGGYTGPGGKYQPAGIVHAGEGVLNQQEISALGGPSGFYAMRDAIEDGRMRAMLHGWAGYADGGMVAPRPRLPEPDFAGFPQGTLTVPRPHVNQKNFLLLDREEVGRAVVESTAFETNVLKVIANNPRALGGG
jgi:hypothetical protein